MAMIGNPIVSTDFPKDTFSGNGSTTAFTMQIAPASVNSVIVVVSGITQDPSTYTISGTTLTFSAAPPTGTSNISVRHLGIAGIPNTPSAGSVVATSIADGVITAAKFASGQTPAFNGITFPATQSASADANTLDDYEEGTWTPTPTSGTVTANATFYYTKIGRIVHLSGYIYAGTGYTGSADWRMNGLPFVAGSQDFTAETAFYAPSLSSVSNLLQANVFLSSGNSGVTLALSLSTGAARNATYAEIAGGHVKFNLTYVAA